MPLTCATHSGPFHADDVLAWALITSFHAPDASLVRTRDRALISQADLVFDVGGIFDPDTCRFDHHQSTYEGPLSSAGMVLDWLTERGDVEEGLSTYLRSHLVSYVDDVDNGRVAPVAGVPCFPAMVDAFNQPASTQSEFDIAFGQAATLASAFVTGLVSGFRQQQAATEAVTAAMRTAVAQETNLLFLDSYHRWKPIYFAHGGETHPTEFVIFPSTDGTIRVVAIPPKLGDFGQKRSLPESWAGLSDEALGAVTGVAGSVFCHKNRFIAVFKTKEAALDALARFGLIRSAS